ncbi:hypothetical protein B4119_1606 [Parageobacillus caldoxylosilyticus]|uniref:Uncharacterized protein n=1 Tax=Saccharococcus caldoxylosilyticus TaxID=81408 RepID=A0A150LNN9_9BACL|nr:hypothetical protein B4119_1606 [Parageobacillus caldoxylosilyticus]
MYITAKKDKRKGTNQCDHMYYFLNKWIVPVFLMLEERERTWVN